MTLFEAVAGRAFDHLNCQHSGEFDPNFSKKSNARELARGTWAVLKLTGALNVSVNLVNLGQPHNNLGPKKLGYFWPLDGQKFN